MWYNSQENLDNRMTMILGRLQKLVEFKAPSVVIANDVALLLRVAWANYGKAMGRAFGEFMTDPMRNWYGRCGECGGELDDKLDTDCKTCQLKDRAEQDQWEAAHPELDDPEDDPGFQAGMGDEP